MGSVLKLCLGYTTVIDWKNESDDAIVRSSAIDIGNKWKELGTSRGSHIPYLFMNDASRDQNPLASYGITNLQRLRQVSAKYDKTQVFQKLQNDGFLLSKL